MRLEILHQLRDLIANPVKVHRQERGIGPRSEKVSNGSRGSNGTGRISKSSRIRSYMHLSKKRGAHDRSCAPKTVQVRLISLSAVLTPAGYLLRSVWHRGLLLSRVEDVPGRWFDCIGKGCAQSARMPGLGGAAPAVTLTPTARTGHTDHASFTIYSNSVTRGSVMSQYATVRTRLYRARLYPPWI